MRARYSACNCRQNNHKRQRIVVISYCIVTRLDRISKFNYFTLQTCIHGRPFIPEDSSYVQSIQSRSNDRLALSGVGVSKPILSVPLFSQIFRMMKTVVTWIISSSYLAGVTAAELRRHLEIWTWLKVSNLYSCKIKFPVTEKLKNGALVTPTPGL